MPSINSVQAVKDAFPDNSCRQEIDLGAEEASLQSRQDVEKEMIKVRDFQRGRHEEFLGKDFVLVNGNGKKVFWVYTNEQKNNIPEEFYGTFIEMFKKVEWIEKKIGNIIEKMN